MTLGLCTPVFFIPLPWSVFNPTVTFVHSFEMSLVVKTLSCGSFSNGNSRSGDSNKSMHKRQNTGGRMSSKKVKVS